MGFFQYFQRDVCIIRVPSCWHMHFDTICKRQAIGVSHSCLKGLKLAVLPGLVLVLVSQDIQGCFMTFTLGLAWLYSLKLHSMDWQETQQKLQHQKMWKILSHCEILSCDQNMSRRDPSRSHEGMRWLCFARHTVQYLQGLFFHDVQEFSLAHSLLWIDRIKSCAVTGESDAVAMNEIEVSESNSTSFDSLPETWLIPIRDIKLVAEDGKLKVLGKGAYGLVYQAVVRTENAAIKIVQGGSSAKQARLMHEIKVLERCKSCHIVQFLGYSISPEGLLLCMEYMNRGTLYHSLQDSDEFRWHNRWVDCQHADHSLTLQNYWM